LSHRDYIAASLAEFAVSIKYDDIHIKLIERAKFLILDGIGCALAARNDHFVRPFWDSSSDFASGSQGTSGVIGFSKRMTLRDAIFLNGVLMHGLDYDDTHTVGIIHLTVSSLPASLNLASQLKLSGKEFLTSYIVGLEAGARLAMMAKGGFHSQGFHPTGLVGTFASALACGRLLGLNQKQMIYAQGAALSLTGGSLQFIEDGAWTKRAHAGWSSHSGLMAAFMAKNGVITPEAPYLGRYGLFNSYLPEANKQSIDLEEARETFDFSRPEKVVWELPEIAVKPFAMCHFTHAAIDAAISLNKLGLDVVSIDSIEVLVPDAAVPLVCEPLALKQKPQNEYEAKFSLPYAVASGLLRGRLGLKELLPEAYLSIDAQELMSKVQYRVDPGTTFPRHYSPEVCVIMKNGDQHSRRESINRGHSDRPLNNNDVRDKYDENAGVNYKNEYSDQLAKVITNIEKLESIDSLEVLLAQDPV